MHTTYQFDHSANEWRIRVGKIFDVEEAKACIQRFRNFKEDRLRRLVFDLTDTHNIHTAGLGTMLFIRGCCQVPDEDAHIIYLDPQVGMILKLANLGRWFTLVPEGAALHEEKVSMRPVQAQRYAS